MPPAEPAIPHLTFVPGAAGRAAFWAPVAELLPAVWPRTFVDLPGLGAVPAIPEVTSYDALVDHVAGQVHQPTVLVGQSMGAYLAMRVALARPALVRRLVLTVAAAGVDMTAHGATDWRPGYHAEHPAAAAWATDPVPALDGQLARLAPTLLFWATRDPISPLAVADTLARGIPAAVLVTIDTDDHWVVRAHAAATAAAIERFVSEGA